MRHLVVPASLTALFAAPWTACGGNSTHYLVVTVDARPAVHDAASISVSLANAGTTRMDSFDLRSHAFPVTFSISAPERDGDLAITVDATDASGQVVGHGTVAAKIASDSAAVMLDATDFVVNTDYAGDQFPSNDFEAAGFQLAALPDGSWIAVFRDSCASQAGCNLFARRFGATGAPLTSQAAAGTNAFVISAKPSTNSSTPAVASNHTSSIAIWDFFDTGAATTSGIACRAIDATGALGAAQTAIGTDPADVVSVAALSNDSFLATWKTVTVDALDTIRMAVIAPDCTSPGGVQTVAQGATTSDLVRRGSVASSGDQAAIAWIANGDLHVRRTPNTGALAADSVPVPSTATEEVAHARIAAATGGGFALAARWDQKSATTGPGRIELFRLTADGTVTGPATLVTDQSATDFDNSESFGMTSRADGTVLVAWHTCGALGDDSQCGVFGRMLREDPAGPGYLPLTDRFVIPTTTQGDQQLPSVAALPDAFVAVWSDASARPPDTAGLAVRARILYPPAM